VTWDIANVLCFIGKMREKNWVEK